MSYGTRIETEHLSLNQGIIDSFGLEETMVHFIIMEN